MSGMGPGISLAVAGLLAAALAGRQIPAGWASGAIGGITGVFGIAALRLSGYGDLEFLALVGVMIVYGLLVGLAAMLGKKMGAQR